MSVRWRETAPAAGPRSRAAVAVIVALGGLWLGWPVWSSYTAPGRDALRVLTPYLLAALVGLLLVLALALWRDVGRRAEVFAPVVLLAAVDVFVRVFLSPGAAGIEPVFALPLLAGVALGGPAGFLTGALACLASSALLGLVAEPLVAQTLVWGLWGAVGGWLRPLRAAPAWAWAIVLCLPLGLATGLLLNASGWSGESSVEVGGFLPGAGAGESLRRLLDYTAATSLTVDLVRGITNAAVAALVGLPLLRALRAATRPPAHLGTGIPAPPRVAPAAFERRARSDRLTTLWTPDDRSTR